MVTFTLPFKKNTIQEWADRHVPLNKSLDDEIVNILPEQIRVRGYFTKQDLQKYCLWKSPRTKSRVAKNSADFVEEVTRIALSTNNERLRIEVLVLLHGVNWPSASVLLHFGYENLYPILDFRVLWSLGIERGSVPYNFDLWWAYASYCRKIAGEVGVSMRTLDLALWQYSKEIQLSRQYGML